MEKAIIATILALLIACTQTTNTPGNITIQAKYPEKIVYGTSQDVDFTPLIEDCKQRGGRFNECGTVCEPGAKYCAAVCALTCELA
ncbi:hypothetical protein D6825_03585 [Candidatus Woesearchaeota archaeon]|nr:MAG: hypothetical protein D6825_03585 [Candidatus Woesearchaeota archaeon]